MCVIIEGKIKDEPSIKPGTLVYDCANVCIITTEKHLTDSMCVWVVNIQTGELYSVRFMNLKFISTQLTISN